MCRAEHGFVMKHVGCLTNSVCMPLDVNRGCSNRRRSRAQHIAQPHEHATDSQDQQVDRRAENSGKRAVRRPQRVADRPTKGSGVPGQQQEGLVEVA